MSSSTENLKRTPLYAAHVQAGAKMVPFGGWDMPVQYDGILGEHQAVRQKVGVFDISHMGEFLVAGPEAEAVLNRLLTNDVRKTAVGQGQYTLMCNEAGGVVDDLIFYRIEPTVFLLVVNAGNIDKDFAWIKAHAHAPIVLENNSDRTAALALQGPDAIKILPEVANLAPFHIVKISLFGKSCWVARTGYTGEDGFEILCDAADATPLWNELLKRGVKPCGLGARDTLRLEACLPLHGNDITDQTTPIEAGLNRFVSLDKGEFIGRSVMAEQREKGVARKLMAFKMSAEKCPPPRSHYAIMAGGRKIGEVSSGSQSPTMGGGIGLGYIETASAVVSAAIEIEVRGKMFPAVIEKKPLYKRGK